MTTHYSSDFLVKTYAVLLSYKAKDDTKQVAIRVRIIERKTKKENRTNIVCYDELNESIKLTTIAFKSNKYDIKIKNRIAEIDERVKFAIHHFLSHNLTITKKKLTQFVYNKMSDEQKTVFSDENVDDPVIVEQLENIGIDTPVAKDVVSKFATLKEDDFRNDETGEQIDIEDVINGIQAEYDQKIRDEEISKMGVDVRYKKGHFNKENIFDIFGFCWSISKKKGKPYISDGYKSLILKMADYRVNAQPDEHVSKFNEKWISDFILFLKLEGYAKVHPKNYTPFTIKEYDFKLLTAERNVYTYSGFDKQIKHLKKYIDTVQGAGLIPKHTVDTRFINTSDYIANNTVTYTRSSHALNTSEIELILNSRLDGKNETARQMFLIQTFAGGLRNEEFYNKYFKLAHANDMWYFMYYASKVDVAVENPLIEGYSDVLLKQISYELPVFLKVDEYRAKLTEVASELKLNRNIRYLIPMANGKTQVIDKKIWEIINPYWCRKSFVRFAYSLGWTGDKIIQWTGHGDTKTLKSYFDQLSAEEKRTQ
jgi:hypothetical protein